MTRWSAITRTRARRSALAYGSRSTTGAETTSTGSYTTSGDATQLWSRLQISHFVAVGPSLCTPRADVETEDAGITAVQDPEAVHARLDLEERPNLAVDEHRVAEVLADPGDALDVTGRVEERPVRVELAVLHDERDLVGAAGNPDRVRFVAGVELVANNVGVSGGRGEFHPPAPSDPGVTVSRHRALVVLVTRVWPSMPSGQTAVVAGG